jgi:putative flippase GtrA
LYVVEIGLNQRIREFVRFAVVGLACFAIDAGILVALRTGTPVPLALDAALAFGIASLINFVLSRQWVFSNARAGKPHADLARFTVLVGAGLAVTTVTVPVLAVMGLDYKLAKLVASGLVALLNFVVLPRLVFRSRPA